MRTFVCVQEPNTRFQIKEGADKLNQPFVGVGGVIPVTNRTGDKFVAFVDGLFHSDDSESIEWCESQYPLVMDIENPETATLVLMANMQTPRAEYEPEIRGDLVGSTATALQESVRRAVEAELARRAAGGSVDPMPVFGSASGSNGEAK